jgi:hypothetical protein
MCFLSAVRYKLQDLPVEVEVLSDDDDSSSAASYDPGDWMSDGSSVATRSVPMSDSECEIVIFVD